MAEETKATSLITGGAAASGDKTRLSLTASDTCGVRRNVRAEGFITKEADKPAIAPSSERTALTLVKVDGIF